MEFLVPLHDVDLELEKTDRYFVQNCDAVEDYTSSETEDRLDALENAVLSDEYSQEILKEEWFDLTYSFVKKIRDIKVKTQMRFLQMLVSFVKNVTNGIKLMNNENHMTNSIKNHSSCIDLNEIMQLRSAFKACIYFLITSLSNLIQNQIEMEKDVVKKKRKTQNIENTSTITSAVWTQLTTQALDVLEKSICPEVFKLWKMNLPEEEFTMLYVKIVFHLFENANLCRGKQVKPKMYHIIGRCLKLCPSIHISVVTSLIELIYAHEHLSGPIAELMEILSVEYDNTVFAADTISEIGKNTSIADGSSKDSTGTKNLATFLATLSSRCPSLMLANLSFVLGLLDVESYQLRNAAVTSLTQLLLWHYKQKKVASSVSANDNNSRNEEVTEQDRPSQRDISKMIESKTFSRETRNQLLGILEDRINDVTSFCRSHVLKSWYTLCESGAIPIEMIHSVTSLTVGRLHDKAAIVRRHSIHLLTLFLENNPFMGQLDRSFYISKRTELVELMKEKQAALLNVAEKEFNDVDMGSTDENTVKKEIIEPSVANPEVVERELKALTRLLNFYTDAIQFIEELEDRALPLIAQLLSSKTLTDVLEAMHFFEQVYHAKFSTKTANTGVKKMLGLIWRADVSVQEECLKMFESLFLNLKLTTGENQIYITPETVAENLLKLLDDCTVAEYTSLEKIMADLHSANRVPSAVIAVLWDFVDETEYPVSVLANAISLLSMLASVDEGILLSSGDRLHQLQTNGFGKVACEVDTSCRIIRAACQLVQCLQFDRNTISSTKRTSRIDVGSVQAIVTKLEKFLTLQFLQSHAQLSKCVDSWFDCAQQAIDAIFVLCDKPERVMEDILKQVATSCYESGIVNALASFELAHFLFLCGHVAVKVAVHVETSAAAVKKARTQSANLKDSNPQKQAQGTTSMEEELGVAAEVEAEEDTFVNMTIQKDIVCRNLLGSYAPIIIWVLRCDVESVKSDSVLTEAAVVALMKFMAVSEEFCESHLQLLFTILQESPLPSVRGNIIVALGDLSFRFPNLIEPWTQHLYNRLRDVDTIVRKNTIVVLSHLILNDMIKVKAQFADIAASLVDEQSDIRNLTKLFFYELSKKGNNPIYNMLPDAIGQLASIDLDYTPDEEKQTDSSLQEISTPATSTTTRLVSVEEFEEIAKFLAQFITKDKQNETIIEKLTQRFGTAISLKNPTPQRCISFAISQLQQTEKSLRYLYTNQKIFREALMRDEVVGGHFTYLISRTKRASGGTAMTSELKDAIEQLEKYVNKQINGDKVDNDSADNDDEMNAKEPEPKEGKKNSSASSRKRVKHGSKSTKNKGESSSSDSDIEFQKKEAKKSKLKTGKSKGKARRTAQKAKKMEDSESD